MVILVLPSTCPHLLSHLFPKENKKTLSSPTVRMELMTVSIKARALINFAKHVKIYLLSLLSTRSIVLTTARIASPIEPGGS